MSPCRQFCASLNNYIVTIWQSVYLTLIKISVAYRIDKQRLIRNKIVLLSEKPYFYKRKVDGALSSPVDYGSPSSV